MTPELIQALVELRGDPYGFVLFAFPWGEGELRNLSGPEPWQRALLERVGRGLSINDAVLEAVASGHGVGKSALVSWLILWAMSTETDTRIVLTANTEAQLRTKTWVELAKWYRLFIAKEMFSFEATTLKSADPDREKTWRCDMVPWSERNPEAFAGLHNQGRRVVMIYDEASSIPDIIWETSEGFLSDEGTERLWFVFGNPTRSVGRFRKSFDDARWNTTQVDSRDVSFTNKKQIASWEKAYGEDSDFFRVRVRGVFPRVGASEFISAWVVANARTRDVEVSLYDPLVFGVDVARYGDDETVIVIRKGRDARSIPAVRLRGLDTMGVARRVVELSEQYHPDAIFVDGGGVGGGVVDRLRELRLHVFDINFGQAADYTDMASRGEKYVNKRAEMWGAMRTWLEGGAIEDDAALEEQLVGPQYGMVDRKDGTYIQLERKQDMKARGLPSPDWADGLALTFALPVVANLNAGRLGFVDNTFQHEYDPFSDVRMRA